MNYTEVRKRKNRRRPYLGRGIAIGIFLAGIIAYGLNQYAGRNSTLKVYEQTKGMNVYKLDRPFPIPDEIFIGGGKEAVPLESLLSKVEDKNIKKKIEERVKEITSK